MATLTVYPVAGANSPCDGAIVYDSTISWANSRAGTGTPTTSVTDATTVIQGEKIGGTQWSIRHIIFNFDTSALGAGAIITGAVFSAYGTGVGDNSESTYPANGALVGASPASPANLTNGDFTTLGATRFADTDIPISGYASAGYKDWTLNATGLAALNKTGITSLGIKPSNDFSDATAPTLRSYWQINMADNGTNIPKLVVTYTVASNTGAGFFMMM